MAFCYGFDDFDGLLFKSTDNGDTWEKTVVFKSSIDPFNVPEDSDIIPCGDGTCAIALDSQGKAHITFSKKLMYYESGSYFCHPTGTDGVIYSDESMAPLGTTIFSSYTNQYLRRKLMDWPRRPEHRFTISVFGMCISRHFADRK